MITRMLWRCGMKFVAAGRKEKEMTTCMPRSRRWFSGDMFRPAFNFAQKLKWYRSVSGRKEFTTRGDWKKKLGRRRRPAGARQNLNPFKQLPHFPGVYNSWEAAPAASTENCAVKNISTLVNRHTGAGARVNFHGKRIARNDLLAFVLAPRGDVFMNYARSYSASRGREYADATCPRAYDNVLQIIIR